MNNQHITTSKLTQLIQQKFSKNARLQYTVNRNKRGWFVFMSNKDPLFIGANKHEAFAYLHNLNGNEKLYGFPTSPSSFTGRSWGKFQDAFSKGDK